MERTDRSADARPAALRAVAERAALAAALAAPLCFAVFTERVFEAEKAGAVRFLGAVALLGLAGAAAANRAVRMRRSPEAGQPAGSGARATAAHPIAVAALATWAAGALATAASVAPAASLMGSYDRGQGLITDTALLALGAAAAAVAARPGGTARLAAFLGIAALPAGLYGLVQRAGLDPVPWLGDVVTRVSGPAGASPLYAGHLVMALPFAVWRAGAAWRAAAAAPASRAAGAHLAAWLLAVAAGVAGLALSASRGPLLGAVAGLAVGAAAWSAVRGRRVAAAGIAAALVAAAGLLVALNRVPEAFGPVARLPIVARFATALDPERDTTRVRMRLWEGSVAALADRPDRWATGFGPEAMPNAWAPYYPPILAYDEPRGWVPDRAHALWLDALLTTGLVGAAALLALLTAAAFAALRALGLMDAPGAARGALAAWLGGGVAAAAAARVADGGWRLAAPAFGLGLVAGLVAWLAWRAARRPAPRAAGPTGGAAARVAPRVPAGFALAALAALVAHLAETQVGFPSMATRVDLWLVAGGLLGAAASASRPVAPDGVAGASEAAPHSTSDAASDAVLAALVVGATLVFDFARPGLVSGGAVVAGALVALSTLGTALLAPPGGWRGSRRTGAGDPPTTAASWMGGLPEGTASAPITAVDAGPTPSAWWTARRAVAVVAGLVGYGALHLGLLRMLARDPGTGAAGGVATVAAYGAMLALVLAWVEPAGSPPGQPAAAPGSAARGSAFGAGWALAVALAALLAAAPVWLAPAAADALAKEARRVWEDRSEAARARGQSGRAEALLGQALERYALAERLAPWEPAHALSRAFALDVHAALLDERLARALAEAGAPEGADEYRPEALGGRARELALARDGRFEAALAAMARAERLAGPWPRPVLARARALRVWGDLTRSAGPRAERLAAARAAYDAAARLAPGWPEVLEEAARTARLAGDPDDALALAKRAVALDPYYSAAWRTAADAHMGLGDPAAAAEALDRYFLDDRNAGDVPALRARVRALVAAGRDADALTSARDAVRLAPGDAHALADLAAVLERTGDRAGALEAARSASELAPDDAGIAALLTRLDASPRQGEDEPAAP